MQRIACFALALFPLLASAQSSVDAPQGVVREVQGDLDAPRLNNSLARDAIKVEAGTANSQVSIKSSTKLADGKGVSRTLSLIASAPLGKGATEGTLATRRGLNSGTMLTLALAQTTLKGIRVPAEEVLNLCAKGQKFLTAYLSVLGNKEENFLCDTATIKDLLEQGKVTKEEYRAFRSAFFGPSAAVSSWAVSLSGGYNDANYFDAVTLVQAKKRNRVGGLAVSYTYVPLEATQLFSASLGLLSVYKDAKNSTACLPLAPGKTQLTCASGAIGAPKRQTTQTLDLEWRRKLSERYAFSLQVSRDFKNKVTSVAVPIYLVGNDKDGLTGGISLGWASDDKDVTAGVFVGKAFSVQP